MKKALVIIAVLALQSCTWVADSELDRNQKNMQAWIDTVQKPIVAHLMSVAGSNIYTLRSADNQFYYTKDLRIFVPDTIR